MLAATVIFFRLRIGNSSVQSLLECFRVGAFHSDPSIVLLEGVNFLDILEFVLKRILNS